MLKQGEIPATEPNVAVGIVLPRDRHVQLAVSVPPVAARYVISSSAGNLSVRVAGTTVHFAIDSSGVPSCRAEGLEPVTARRFRLQPVRALQPGEGPALLVHNVIAGRDFHWRKRIDVRLPGALAIAARDGALVVINEVPLEQYLMCVATSEMSAQCPAALIEAQTIAARSWLLANVEGKHRELGMDACNDDCCQRYQGIAGLTGHAIAGARATRGQVLMHAGKICDARYSKSCGGMLEAGEMIWPETVWPYLQAKPDLPAATRIRLPDLRTATGVRRWVESPPAAFCSAAYVPPEKLGLYLGGVDEDGEYYRWQIAFSQQELTSMLNKKLALNADVVQDVRILQRGFSGRAIRLRIGYRNAGGEAKDHVLTSEYAIRAALHERFLYSSAIAITPVGRRDRPERFIIDGCGWGHGAGLCQIGALGMAFAGFSAEKILAHYYPGSRLEKIY